MDNQQPTLNKKYLKKLLKQLRNEKQISFLEKKFDYNYIVCNVNLKPLVNYFLGKGNDSFKKHFSSSSLNYIYLLCELIDQDYPIHSVDFKEPNYLECQNNVLSFYKEENSSSYSFLKDYFCSSNDHFHIVKPNPIVPLSLRIGSNATVILNEIFVSIEDTEQNKIEYDMVHEFQHALDFSQEKPDVFFLMREANPILREFQYLDKNSQTLNLYYDRLDYLRSIAIETLNAIDGKDLSFDRFVEGFIYIQSYLQALEMRNKQKQGMSKIELLELMKFNLEPYNVWSNYFNYPITGTIPMIPIRNHFEFLEELEKDKRFIK